jgi:drug/metabolite transporter (DMT)-like permease
MAVALALASALCYGISDFGGGLASRRVPATTVVLISNGLSLLLALAVVTLVPGSMYTASDMLWGALSGVVGVVGVVLLYRGLAIGPMAVIAPLTAVLSAIVPVVVGAARGERPGLVALCGVVIAMPAMALISREPGDDGSPVQKAGRVSRAAIASALCAGISFGGFFVLLAQTGSGGGAWPLVSQRAASVAVLVLASAVTRRRRGPPSLTRPTVLLALLAGLTDFAANLAYVLATHHGLLALVAVIASLYPAGTVLLARAVLAEKLAGHQTVGLVLAAAAVALIAVR